MIYLLNNKFQEEHSEEDTPYFDKEIFLASIERERQNLIDVAKLLNEIITDNRIKKAVLDSLERSTTLYSEMSYGVSDNQITFSNERRTYGLTSTTRKL